MNGCAWAVRADLPRQVAEELQHIAQQEPPTSTLEEAPKHAAEFLSLLAERIAPECDVVAKSVVAAWALAVQASGRIPLYSTSWANHASLSVARKLGLTAYACDWSLYD